MLTISMALLTYYVFYCKKREIGKKLVPFRLNSLAIRPQYCSFFDQPHFFRHEK